MHPYALKIIVQNILEKKGCEGGESTLSALKIMVIHIIFLQLNYFANVWTSHLVLFLFVLSIFD
jgi:hypothetical protein